MTSMLERRAKTSRLPSTPQGGGSTVLRGLAALVAGLVIVVGVPVALLSAFGAPWPSTAPSIDWLTRPITADTLLGVLAVVVWIAWAHFVLCMLVEIVSEVRHRGLAPLVPGGGLGSQALARRIVTAVVLMVSAIGVAAPAATATAVSTPVASVTHAQTTAPHHGAASRQSDGAQSGGAQPGGAQSGGAQSGGAEAGSGGSHADRPAPNALTPATRTDLTSSAVTVYYEVHPPNNRHYDTLWDIAERYLGDGLRYKEIWELNKNAVQTDGQALRNPDLIQPGWVMAMPADASGPGLKVVNHAAKAPEPQQSTGRAQHGSDTTSTQTPTEAGVPGGGTAGGGASGGGGGSAIGSAGAEVADVVRTHAPTLGVAGALAFCGLALARRRRRATAPIGSIWADRAAGGPDHDPDSPDTPPTGGRPGDVRSGDWLAAALRGLGDRPATGIARLLVNPNGAAVVFGGAPDGEPSHGWVAVSDTVWILDREENPLPATATDRAPYPALVCVGIDDDGAVVLVDPEAVDGVVAIEGRDDLARELALSIAVDAASHPWADERLVSMVWFADDIVPLEATGIRRSDDLDRVLESLDNVAELHHRLCREADADSVAAARVAGVDVTWQLVVVAGTPSSEQLGRLRALAADRLAAISVVVVGSVPDAGMRLTARADGRLSSPMFGIDVVCQRAEVAALAAFDGPAAAAVPGLDEVAAVLAGELGGGAETVPVASVSLLGPIVVEAAGPVEPDRIPRLTEAACLIALHPSGIHVNVLTGALWPRGIDDSIRDGVLDQLATWFGHSEDETPVLREQAGVWAFTPGAVQVDWDDMRGWINTAAIDPGRRAHHLRTALDLVRGPVCEDAPTDRYGWLDTMLSVRADVQVVSTLAYLALADAATSEGLYDAAAGVLAEGLGRLPASEELWRERLLVESRREHPQLVQVTRRMYDVLAEHGSPAGASAQTDALVDELIPSFRSASA